MPTRSNLPASGGQKPQTADHLAEKLSRGEASSLDALLALCPDEPLADLDELDRQWMTPREHAKWWTRAAELRVQYPGFQEAYWYLEYMKYGRSRGKLPDRPLPNTGAPLADFVHARVSHGKALWSRDVSAGWTRLQFRDWLKLHIDGKIWIPPLWPEMCGWSEALHKSSASRTVSRAMRPRRLGSCSRRLRAPRRKGRPDEPAERRGHSGAAHGRSLASSATSLGPARWR